MARVLAAEPAGEVDVFAAVDVPEPRAFGTGDDERCRRDATGDVALPLFADAFGLGSLLDCHRYFFRSARISFAARMPSDAPPSM